MKNISREFILQATAADLWELLGELQAKGYNMDVFDEDAGTSRLIHSFTVNGHHIQINVAKGEPDSHTVGGYYDLQTKKEKAQ